MGKTMQFSATGSVCIKTTLSEVTGTQTALLSKTSVKKSGKGLGTARNNKHQSKEASMPQNTFLGKHASVKTMDLLLWKKFSSCSENQILIISIYCLNKIMTVVLHVKMLLMCCSKFHYIKLYMHGEHVLNLNCNFISSHVFIAYLSVTKFSPTCARV